MAEGTQVGGIYYSVTLDTKQAIEAQRDVDKVVGKVETTLNAVTKATKTYTESLDLSAKVNRELEKAAEKAGAAAEKAAQKRAEAAEKAAERESKAAQKKAEAVEKASEREAKAAARVAARVAADAAKAAEREANGGISNKQLEAATRGIGPQVTDIVTGLATGQAPMTVLLQQGGQLKDIFGSVGNAVSAVGGYLLRLISSLTVTGAAVAALAAAFFKGREEAEAFNESITMTGNRSGVTVDQLGTMATRLDALAGITRGKAAEALNVFVQSGVSAAGGLEKLTVAAIRMEQAGGASIEQTAKAFRDLEKDPVAAALKLNEAVNFLSVSTYQQAAALAEQGKQTQATKLLQDAYADAVLERTPKILENVGAIEKAWRGVKNAAKEAWDQILNVGRSKTLDEQIKETMDDMAVIRNRLAQAGSVPFAGRRPSTDRAELAALTARLNALQAAAGFSKQAADADAGRAKSVEAQAKLDKDGEKLLDKKAKEEREIAQARQLGLAAGWTEVQIEERIKAIRASYAEKGGRSEKAKFDAVAYLIGLQEKAAEGYEKIDLAEKQAMQKNAERLKAGDINAEVFEQARTAIRAQASKERQKLAEKEEADATSILRRGFNERDAEALKAAQARQKGQDMARGIIFGGSEIAQIQADAEAKSALLLQYAEEDQANAELYAQARIELERQTNERIRQIVEGEQEKKRKAEVDALSSYGSLFGSMADIVKAFSGEQSKTYRALFAVSKAFAVAEAIMNIQAAIAKASNQPFPANLAAMATVASATAGIIATIKGVQFGGGRQYGGPVTAGTLYRVNEGGRPEMFTAANGAQYMLPTSGGNVSPSGASASPEWKVIVNNAPPGTSATVDQSARIIEIAVGRAKAEVASDIASNSGVVWSAMTGATNVRGRF